MSNDQSKSPEKMERTKAAGEKPAEAQKKIRSLADLEIYANETQAAGSAYVNSALNAINKPLA